MFNTVKDQSVEEICFDSTHVKNVVAELKSNFDSYFHLFIETSAGIIPSYESFFKLSQKFGTTPITANRNFSESFKNIFAKSIDAFEKDREKYIRIFDADILEEYEDDPATFKSVVLRNECPIIHGTLMAKNAKELDNYRRCFKLSNPNLLLEVVKNLYNFGKEYSEKSYLKTNYESLENYTELEMHFMDTDNCTYYGVIGGGIKTLMLYKVYPSLFSSRSKNAIWALYYLTSKKNFGCKMDSEFLIIDIKHSVTKQNYFYPYELFHYYAYEIFKMLNNKAKDMDVFINPEYRYVIVDTFFEFITKLHESEISELSKLFKEDEFNYA